MRQNKKVHLVLGSGGARGIAHIAVIEELEKRGYEIIEVVGCSMGSVIGGIYAAGHLPEYKEWLMSLDRNEVFELTDFTFTSQGFIKGEKIFAKHREMTGDLTIEQLNVPFTAVATDMKNREQVLFTSGDLYTALRASVSIPGVFIPVVMEDRVLVDGGVLNPLPVDLVQKQDDAIIVAVDLNAEYEEGAEIKPLEEKKTNWFDQLLPEDIRLPELKWPGSTNSGDTKKLLEKVKEKDASYSLKDLMENTFSFTQDRLTWYMLKYHQPDVVIRIPRNICKTFEFFKARGIYEYGQQAFLRDSGLE